MPGNLEPLDVGSIQVPYHFRCPIALDLMTDPVTVSTGQTYDRFSIESWIATGNSTCPVTRETLTDFSFIPNHTLRRLIQEWCVSNKAYGVERIPTPKQPADPVTVRSLLNQAATESNSVDVRLSALRRLRRLARDSEKNKVIISTSKVRNVLITVLFNCEDEFAELTHESVAILSLLSLTESECVFIGSDLKKVSYLVKLLSHSSIDIRVNSAALIEIILAGTRSPEIRSEISNVAGIFDGVVGILNYQLAYPRALKVGIKALFALCLVKHHRNTAVTAGAVPALIDRLPEFEKCDTERALATIELLCRSPAGCAAFASHALTVPLLVKIIMRISDRVTEYAAGALLSLCNSSENCRRDSVAAGVLTQLLLLVQSDCTERAKRKAQMLLKLLRDSWLQHAVPNSDNFGCSDVVSFRILV